MSARDSVAALAAASSAAPSPRTKAQPPSHRARGLSVRLCQRRGPRRLRRGRRRGARFFEVRRRRRRGRRKRGREERGGSCPSGRRRRCRRFGASAPRVLAVAVLFFSFLGGVERGFGCRAAPPPPPPLRRQREEPRPVFVFVPGASASTPRFHRRCYRSRRRGPFFGSLDCRGPCCGCCCCRGFFSSFAPSRGRRRRRRSVVAVVTSSSSSLARNRIPRSSPSLSTPSCCRGLLGAADELAARVVVALGVQGETKRLSGSGSSSIRLRRMFRRHRLAFSLLLLFPLSLSLSYFTCGARER